jgi:predicted outer membrane repeat protein
LFESNFFFVFFLEMFCLLLFGFVAQEIAHAQTIGMVTVATLPTPLVANTNYVLSSSITLSGAGDYIGKGNTIITCSTLPCFDVNLATNGNVRFANVTFDLSVVSGTFTSGTFTLFLLRNVGHFEVSNVSFQSAETGSVELVQWRAAGGNLTIRDLGSAAAPVGFGSLLGAATPAQVDALVFKDSYGSCRFDCFTVTTIDGRVPQPSITFDNVHWRQNGTAAQLIRPSGVLASLTVTRSTFFGTVNFESGVVRNITVKHCTMYGGLRARNMTFLHVSDVRFLLDDFVNLRYAAVIDTYNTNGMTLYAENIFATAKRTRDLHLFSLYGDTNSTAVVRNVTADSCRGIITHQQATTPLRQLVLENVRATNTVFLIHSERTRIVTITNVETDAVFETGSDIVFMGSFEEVRVTNMSVEGAVGRDVFRLEGGVPNAVIVMRGVRIHSATFRSVVVARQAASAVARSFEFANFLVRDSKASDSIIDSRTSAAASLTGLSLINATVGATAIFGDFHAINGVLVQRSLLNGVVSLIDARISEPRDVAWTGFDVQNSTFQAYFAVVRFPPTVRVDVSFADWSVRDLVGTALPSNLLYIENQVGEVLIDRVFVSPYASELWNFVQSDRFVLQNSVFERTRRLLWEYTTAANEAIVRNVTVTNGNCDAFERVLSFVDATVTISDLRVSGGTCMALEAIRCNLTLVDSLFERINASSATFVQNSNATIAGTVVRGMRGVSSAFASRGNTAILMREVLFENNSATQSRGGAIQSDNELLRIVDSQFFDNSAVPDGGAIAGSALEVDRSLFRRNSATVDGGAISGANIRITECDFEANVAPSGSALSVRADRCVVFVAKSSFFANTGNSTVQLATGNFIVSVVESCLCNNTAQAGSIDCRNVNGSLVANSSTFADDAQRCPADFYQPSMCPTVGCQRRVPLLKFPRTTTTTTRTESTTASGATSMSSPANSSTIDFATSSSEPDGGLDAGTLGAIIGGSAAGLLIIIGVVVFVVLRKRKTGNNQVAAAAPAASSNSAYGSVTNAVPLNVMGADYDHGGIAAIPPNVPGNYGAAGLQAHPEYESGRL